MKKHTGFSLIEVLFSFMLISVLVIMMTSVFTSTYAQSMAAYDMPNSYNSAQSNAEKSILKLENALSGRYVLKNGSDTSTSGSTADVAGVGGATTIEGYNKLIANEAYNVGPDVGYQGDKRTVFGQEVYMFYTWNTAQQEEEGGVTLREGDTRSDGVVVTAAGAGRLSLDLYSGVGEVKIIKRPTPAINSASIAVVDDEGSSEVEHYNVKPGNTKLKVNNNIDKNTGAKVDTERVSVKWYIANNYKHTLPYMTLDSTKTYRDVVPQYPNDFVLISTEEGGSQEGAIGKVEDLTLTVKEEYLGKFIVATVTPISSGGVYGNSVVTNMIYLSALPWLSKIGRAHV